MKDHAHSESIGLIDESGVHKSGDETAGVVRQYNGNRGKLENCIVGVHLGYSAPGFQAILDSQLYLPWDWACDHLEARGWRCIHRHLHVTALSFLLFTVSNQKLALSN